MMPERNAEKRNLHIGESAVAFAMDRPKATRVMLEVHTQGKGVCGIFTYESAETKVAQSCSYADQHQHPLLCTLEEID